MTERQMIFYIENNRKRENEAITWERQNEKGNYKENKKTDKETRENWALIWEWTTRKKVISLRKQLIAAYCSLLQLIAAYCSRVLANLQEAVSDSLGWSVDTTLLIFSCIRPCFNIILSGDVKQKGFVRCCCCVCAFFYSRSARLHNPLCNVC